MANLAQRYGLKASSMSMVREFPAWYSTDILLAHLNSLRPGQHGENPDGDKIPLILSVSKDQQSDFITFSGNNTRAGGRDMFNTI